MNARWYRVQRSKFRLIKEPFLLTTESEGVMCSFE